MAHAGLWSRSKASVIDCEDQDGVDSYGDGCDWYDSNVAECGNYDTEDFAATDACCSCMIQHEEIQSEIYTCSDDLTVTDSYGDGCGWYDDNPGGCGEYDTDDFIAANACVSCGACDVSPSSCGDDLTVVDSYGDNCTWYNENQGECGEYDTASFVAEDACVSCGACSGCTNGTGVDSYGDGCEWYATNQSECGNYDTEDF